MTKWLLNNSRVYTNGEGKSFNLNNKITAQTLHTTLTNYENKLKQMEKQINTDKNYKEIQQQFIALQMDIKVVQDDIDKIKELLKWK